MMMQEITAQEITTQRVATQKMASMSVQVSSRRVKTAVFTIAGFNIFLLAGAWLFTFYYRNILGNNWDAGTAVKYLLIQFNLATENVMAVWYSAMLLLLIAPIAGLCFVVDKQRSTSARDKVLSYGWLMFGSVFALLSLDELGSLHEGLGMLAVLNPLGNYALGWTDLLIIPIGSVALFMLFFGWVHIRRSRRALVFMVIGVALFLTIPLQEKIEMTLWHSFADRDAWLRPIWHLLLEEGAEIFGSLFFFTATAVYLLDALKETMGEKRPFLINLRTPFRNVILVGGGGLLMLTAAFIVASLAAPYLSSGDDGIVQNWFPSALAAIAGLLCWQLWDSAPQTETRKRWTYLIAALFFALLSSYYGAYLRGWLWGDSGMKMAVRYLVNGGLSITAVLLSLALAAQIKTGWARVSILAWAFLFLLAMAQYSVFAGILDFVALAVLFPGLAVNFLSVQTPIRQSDHNRIML